MDKDLKSMRLFMLNKICVCLVCKCAKLYMCRFIPTSNIKMSKDTNPLSSSILEHSMLTRLMTAREGYIHQ